MVGRLVLLRRGVQVRRWGDGRLHVPRPLHGRPVQQQRLGLFWRGLVRLPLPAPQNRRASDM
jgi:hypothetical protein